MKKLATFGSMLMFCAGSLAAQTLVTHNNSYYEDGKFVEKHMGKQVAIEGIISQIEDGPGGRPILELNLTNNTNKALWVGSIINNKKFIKVGDKVRVMGFFDKTAMETEYMSKITKDREYLLGFCFYDMNTQTTMYVPKWMKECIAWEKGTLTNTLSQ
jgi:hypothetical protein